MLFFLIFEILRTSSVRKGAIVKFSINQSELQNALSVVMKGISTRSTLPILSGVFIQAQNDTLTMQTTDLELSIQFTVDALIEEPGDIVVPGKLFSEIIKNLPDAAVHIDGNEEAIVITCDAASFSLKTLNPQDFPGFPKVETHQNITIPFEQFSSMVKRVARVVSKDESRAILTGVLIVLEDKHLKMVATDSYRLAITEAEVPDDMGGEFDAVISGSFLMDIASMSKASDAISLALAENQIVITYDKTVFVNRRIEGNFPNYRQLLPDMHTTRVALNVSHLISAVKRASLLSNTAMPVKFDVNIDSQTVQLSSTAQDIGSTQETLVCDAVGEDVEIAFNYAYMLDGLNAVATETVYLEAQTSMKPGIFKSDEPENFLYLVMPVRIS